MKTSPETAITPPTGAPRDPLVAVLLDVLHALADAGEPQRAGELAGRAWSVVRHEQPLEAARINRAMHRLARLEAAASSTTEEP